MIPPTSIDGTDITGATIDGTDVQEITVDGDTVFTAETLPVAYSNLVAWYPFDSSFYGGSNADDVTALFNAAQSGDSTAYDGTVNGATYQSSGSVTDINAGPNSGAFDFDGSNDEIEVSSSLNQFSGSDEFSLTLWVNSDRTNFQELLNTGTDNNPGWRFLIENPGKLRFDSSQTQSRVRGSVVGTSLTHVAATYNAGSVTLYQDGSVDASGTVTTITQSSNKVLIGYYPTNIGYFEGVIDDIRVYDKELSSSEVSDIYTNTKP